MEENIDAIESLVSAIRRDLDKAGSGSNKSGWKPIPEYKAIQNVAPLTEEKTKFDEWNREFVNAMGLKDGEAVRMLPQSIRQSQ